MGKKTRPAWVIHLGDNLAHFRDIMAAIMLSAKLSCSAWF